MFWSARSHHCPRETGKRDGMGSCLRRNHGACAVECSGVETELRGVVVAAAFGSLTDSARIATKGWGHRRLLPVRPRPGPHGSLESRSAVSYPGFESVTARSRRRDRSMAHSLHHKARAQSRQPHWQRDDINCPLPRRAGRFANRGEK